jgi:hypothetical protein
MNYHPLTWLTWFAWGFFMSCGWQAGSILFNYGFEKVRDRWFR